MIAAIDSHLLEDEVIRSWAKNPDVYSSGITGTAYIMIKRSFAPPEVRLKALVARERLMLKTLEEGRKNLDNPPPIYTDIAIQQIDGNIGFFKSSVPAAFTTSRIRRCCVISRRPTRRSSTRSRNTRRSCRRI